MANEFDHTGFAKAQEAATKYNVTSQPPKPEEEPKNDFEKAQRRATQYDASNAWKAEAAKPEQVAKAPETNKPGDKKPDLGVHDQAQWQNVTKDTKPSEEKSKPVVTAAAPVDLDPNRMAINGDLNKVLPKTDDTLALQKALDQAGFEPGPLDGKQGPLTNASIVAFSEKIGVDPKTTSVKEMIEHAEKFVKLQVAYNQEFGTDGSQLAQKTTTPSTPTADASKRQPVSENTDLAWDKAAEMYYNPKRLNDLNGTTTASFGEAAAKPQDQQPTHSLVQNMNLLSIFKPASPA